MVTASHNKERKPAKHKSEVLTCQATDTVTALRNKENKSKGEPERRGTTG